jgi:hypothetical protein
VSPADPSVLRRPWVAALLLGTVITPACVVLAWLAPRPLDAVVALPLVLMDIRAAKVEAPFTRILLLNAGIGLTWLFYVVAARLVLRLLPRLHGRGDPE